MEIKDIQREISAWADEAFPDRTVKSSLAKLMCEELPEFITARMADPLEYADVIIMVLDLAHQMGIDVQDAIARKMTINRGRTWVKDPDTGFYSHVKEG